MGLYSGVGGYTKTGGQTHNISNWTLNKKGDLAESTHSGSGGWRNRQGTHRDSNGTFEMDWDSSDDPDEKGYYETASVTLTMARGTSGKGFQVPALIESVAYKNDARAGLITLVITWQGNGPCVSVNL